MSTTSCRVPIEGRFIFDELGKERFRQLLEAHAEMAGIEVFTWWSMSNHFHLLIEVPKAEESRAKLDDEEILRRLGLVMEEESLIGGCQMLERMKVARNREKRKLKREQGARPLKATPLKQWRRLVDLRG